ncbi:hypothetical protein Tco_0290367 [Tanacetum coccineum]
MDVEERLVVGGAAWSVFEGAGVINSQTDVGWFSGGVRNSWFGGLHVDWCVSNRLAVVGLACPVVEEVVGSWGSIASVLWVVAFRGIVSRGRALQSGGMAKSVGVELAKMAEDGRYPRVVFGFYSECCGNVAFWEKDVVWGGGCGCKEVVGLGWPVVVSWSSRGVDMRTRARRGARWVAGRKVGVAGMFVTVKGSGWRDVSVLGPGWEGSGVKGVLRE